MPVIRTSCTSEQNFPFFFKASISFLEYVSCLFFRKCGCDVSIWHSVVEIEICCIVSQSTTRGSYFLFVEWRVCKGHEREDPFVNLVGATYPVPKNLIPISYSRLIQMTVYLGKMSFWYLNSVDFF